MTNDERRKAIPEARKKKNGPPTLARLCERYQQIVPAGGRRDVDIYRFNTYLRMPFGDVPAEQLTTAGIDGLRFRVTKAGRRPATVRDVLELLRRIVLFGSRQGLCSPSADLHFTMPEVDNPKTEYTTDEQLARYCKALDEEHDQDGAALLRLALVTGMRNGRSCPAVGWL